MKRLSNRRSARMGGSPALPVALAIGLFFATGISSPECIDGSGLPSLFVTEKARPGDPIVVVLSSKGAMGECSVRLLDSAGKELAKAAAFSYPLSRDLRSKAALLGTWSTQKPGKLTVEVRWSEGGYSQVLSQELELAERAFPTFDLKATKSMTTLRYSPDPKKEEESTALYELLNGEDPEAKYLDAPFIVPVAAPRVTTEYGERIRYLYTDGSITQNAHAGIDFGAPTGTPVQAAGRGRVVMARMRIMTGNTVIIEHLPGVFTQYYHLDSMLVKEGELVERGKQIGTVGTTGFSTGSHLHWDLRVHYVSVDPMAFVAAAPLDKEALSKRLSPTPIEGR